MTEQEKLKDMFETFSFEIIEDYKDVTLLIKRDSSIVSIFGKKHYDEIIRKLERLRKLSSKLDLRSVKTDGPLEKDVADLFASAQNIFNKLCDSQLELQRLLRQKAKRERKVKMSECSEHMHNINEMTEALRNSLRNLDIRWADFLEEIE